MWIRTIGVEEAEGRLKEAYDWQAKRLGHPTEFTQLGSLDPELVHARLTLYRASEGCPSALTPRQRAIIGFVTSVLNETPHCASQVELKLRQLLSAEEIEALRTGGYSELPPAEAELARYARKLTLEPGSMTEEDILRLRERGFGDLEILDANNMCAHLNYVNRIANGLGLRAEVTADFEPYAAIPE